MCLLITNDDDENLVFFPFVYTFSLRLIHLTTFATESNELRQSFMAINYAATNCNQVNRFCYGNFGRLADLIQLITFTAVCH